MTYQINKGKEITYKIKAEDWFKDGVKKNLEELLFAKWYQKRWISYKEYLRLTGLPF